jgi:hypothetical protein
MQQGEPVEPRLESIPPDLLQLAIPSDLDGRDLVEDALRLSVRSEEVIDRIVDAIALFARGSRDGVDTKGPSLERSDGKEPPKAIDLLNPRALA